MFRCAISCLHTIKPLSTQYYKAARIISNEFRNYVTYRNLQSYFQPCSVLSSGSNISYSMSGSLLANRQIMDISKNLTSVVPVRTVTKFSLNKGKRKTAKNVVKRFFRLHWGGWIRTKAGRQKKLWKKSSAQKRRLRQHVFCNATQTKLLDKMVTKFWKRPKYYVDDPYAPYHTREEFFATRKKPLIRE